LVVVFILVDLSQGFIAKKLCPDLILVSNHFSRYTEMSEAVMSVFRRYDPNMSPAGCDEGYLEYAYVYFRWMTG
jgi:nucleotidyltransferase/DNA polymerase involved in DNA repair